MVITVNCEFGRGGFELGRGLLEIFKFAVTLNYVTRQKVKIAAEKQNIFQNFANLR